MAQQVRQTPFSVRVKVTDLESGKPADSAAVKAGIAGSDLRRINPSSVLDAIAIADPSFQVFRNNLSGDDPNVLPEVRIRGAANFPAAAAVATHSAATSTGVQMTPSSADFVADQVTASTRPLFLLNGVQISMQQLVDMDINRIERIVILKDAVATAPYGARGSNGVVLIETAPTKKGDINVRYTGLVQAASADLSSYHLLNAGNKFALENKAGYYNGLPALQSEHASAVSAGINTHWLQVPIQTAVVNKHNLTVDGGDDHVEYGLNFAYSDIQGTMKGSERQTYGLDLHIGARLKAFVIRNDLSYSSMQSSQSPYGNLSDYAKLDPYLSPYDSLTGNFAKVLDQYHIKTAAGADSVVTVYNPAFNSTIATQNTTTYNRIGNTTYAEWMIGRGFALNGRASINYQSDENDVFLPPSNTTFGNFAPAQFFQRGTYDQTTSRWWDVEGELKMNFSRQIGLHHIDANAGISGMFTNSDATGIQVQGFSSDHMANIAFGNGYSNSKPATGMIQDRWVSAFASANYSYDRRYQVDLVGTGFGSSQVGPSNPYAGYWAAGASWNIHNEHFFHRGKVLNELRLKASTGVTGNQFFQSYLNNDSYNYLTNEQYILGGSNLGTRGVGLGAYLSGVGNTHLAAPTSTNSNVGLESVLLDSRLFVNATYYRQQSSGLVLPVYSPAYTGFGSFNYYDNLGGIRNSGVELSLQYAVIRDTKNRVFWNVMASGFHNVNTITATSNYVDSLNAYNNSSAVDQTRPHQLYVKGQSLTSIWAVRSAIIDPATGQELFLRPDGSSTFNWSAADKRVVGDYSPKWQGTFGTSLSVKQISFATYFRYQLGGQIYNQTLADMVENANLANNVDSRAASSKRWQTSGDHAKLKALSANGLQTSPTYATSRFVQNSDQLECASLVLGYTWPSFRNNKLPFQQTGISLVANNAFRVGNNEMERGTAYPFNRTFSLTLTTAIK